MSETGKSKIFDFDRAVAEARQDYPLETKNITFVDLDAPEAAQQIERWKENRNERVLRDFTGKDFSTQSQGFCFTDLTTGEAILGVHSKPAEKNPLLAAQPDKQLWFVFYHELGHFVVPQMKTRWTTRTEGEMNADAFAALNGLAKGFLDAGDIKSVADNRTEYFIKLRELEHMTAPVLDWIAANVKPGNLAGMGGEEMKQLAHEYAVAFTPNYVEYANIEVAMFPRGKALKGLGDIVQSSDALSRSFYIAARALNTAFGSAAASQEEAGFWTKVKQVIDAKTEMLEPGIKKALRAAAPGYPVTLP